MKLLAVIAALLPVAICATLADAEEPGKKKAAASQEQLFKDFESKLSNVKLRGKFTTIKDGELEIKDETYTIRKVKKFGKGDMWLITAHLSYGGQEGNVTLPLPVKWAGDTPVITLNKYEVPNMGVFSARVAFHGDRYFGTWQHDEKGGHIYGVIEKIDEK